MIILTFQNCIKGISDNIELDEHKYKSRGADSAHCFVVKNISTFVFIRNERQTVTFDGRGSGEPVFELIGGAIFFSLIQSKM